MQMCVGCLHLLIHSRDICEQNACSHILTHTSSTFSSSLSGCNWLNTSILGGGVGGQRVHCLHLLIHASLFPSPSLSLSLSADLNYTSFYQASRGSTPAAALFIKYNVQIHISKLMRENQAVNQTTGVSELIRREGDHKLCPLKS